MDAKIQLRKSIRANSCDSRADLSLSYSRVERVVLNALADWVGLCCLISASLAIEPIGLERIHRFYKPALDIGFERNCSGRLATGRVRVAAATGRVARETRPLQPTRLPLQKMFHCVVINAFCFAKMPGIIRLRPAIAGLRRDKPIPATTDYPPSPSRLR
jgi:hypothetical protein